MNNLSAADTSVKNLELTNTAKPSSSEQVNNYRLNQIDKVEDYFNNEINERKDINKKLNKY